MTAVDKIVCNGFGEVLFWECSDGVAGARHPGKKKLSKVVEILFQTNLLLALRLLQEVCEALS